jgi:hypothetical protein
MSAAGTPTLCSTLPHPREVRNEPGTNDEMEQVTSDKQGMSAGKGMQCNARPLAVCSRR